MSTRPISHQQGARPPDLITGEMVGEVKAVADMHQRKAEMARKFDAFIALPDLKAARTLAPGRGGGKEDKGDALPVMQSRLLWAKMNKA
uniref:Uncharacterized protein n=1 Tax=Sorghum bicolor TaxID=4558 RepID=C6JRW4_SORBI